MQSSADPTIEVELGDLNKRASLNPSTTAVPSSKESIRDSLVFHDDDDDDDDDDDSPKISWLSLLTFINKRHYLVFTAGLSLSVISGLVVPLMAILLGKIFGAFGEFGSGSLDSTEFMEEVTNHIIRLAILGCSSWLFNGAFFTSWIWFGELQAKAAREKLFDGLIDKELGWFEERKNGASAIISKCQTQINELQTAISQPLGYATQSIVVTIASLGVALYHSWSLTLVILAIVPISVGFLGFLSVRMQPHINRQKSYLEHATTVVSCAISSIETVKAFNGQSSEQNSFSKAVYRAAKEHRSQANINALQIGIIRVLTFGMFVQGFWYGGKLVRDGNDQFTPADIMTTFWSCLMATQALGLIIPKMIILEKGRAAGAGLKALLVKMEKRDDCFRRFGGQIPTKCDGEIEIKGVSFIYPSRPAELALTNVSLFIPANETTFIVGRSGSGKSTLGSLIINAYSPLSGDILIDGYSTRNLDPRYIRDSVSLIQQQSVLFDETIFQNIAFGRKDYENITRSQVQDACKMAAFEKTILELTSGLDTVVGVGGKQLSGGQIQRVALARDRLRDATVLILDEALSSLDVSNRRIVFSALRRWRRGKTTIVITHDMSEVERNDFLYVMEGGMVVQQGYRRELENMAGAFQSFVTENSSTPQRCRERVSSLIYIPELDTEFWNSSSPDLTLVPSPLSLGDNGVGYNVEKRISPLPLPPISVVRDRRLSEVSTIAELSPGLPNTSIATSPVESDFSGSISRRNSCSVVQRGASICSDTGPDISESKAMIPKSIISISRKLKEKHSVFDILGTVWPTLSPRLKGFLVLGFLAALLHAVAIPVFSYILARLLDSVLDITVSEVEMTKWSLSIVGIAVVDAINCYLMYYLLETCGQSWVDHIRVRSFIRILDQPRVWFYEDKSSVSNITEDLEKHVEEMRNLLARFAGYGFVGLSLTVIAVVWSVATSWKLALVGLCIAPVMYAISRGMRWTSDKYETKCNDAAQATGGILHDAITNIRIVRNYHLERYFRKKYFDATKSGFQTGIKRSLYAGVWFGLSDSAVLFATALIFYYGALLICQDQENFQDVLSVFTLLLFSLSGASATIGLIPQISNCKDSATRVLRLSNLPQDSHEHTGDLTLPPASGAISFNSVTFFYPTRPSATILHDFTLEIPAGDCIALTGASGCGKSTVSALLQRFYVPNEGEITISAQPLTSFSTPHLREQLAIVAQNPILFDATIAENITYGLARSWTEADVVWAAEMAGIHEFITTLPEGYDTLLGDGGTVMSSGQAQRVAIARALVRKPRVLILDECTSNLDSESALLVKESVLRLVQEEMGRMTVIIVTHNVELMKVAKRVIVLDGGRVVEDGCYGELVGNGGPLARLLSGL